MAKLKILRYPKKPKASASVSSLENYLSKCNDIDKKNNARKAENSKKETLRKKVSARKQKI